MRWIDAMFDHLAGPSFDKDDAAEWLSYFLGGKYDAAYTLASEALGLPLVERLDDASAQAMFSDANINVTQKRILKKNIYVFTLGSASSFLNSRLVMIGRTTMSLHLMVNINVTRR
jgi:hypothetical protein